MLLDFGLGAAGQNDINALTGTLFASFEANASGTT
jgi:hypothetical protein